MSSLWKFVFFFFRKTQIEIFSGPVYNMLRIFVVECIVMGMVCYYFFDVNESLDVLKYIYFYMMKEKSFIVNSIRLHAKLFQKNLAT